MPIADWGLSKGTIANFDREKQKQYEPYTGPKPSAGVYKWSIVKDRMKRAAGDDQDFPRLTAMLMLVPRTREEKRYKGYRAWFSANISDENPQWYVPLLDVLGVTDAQFRLKTKITDEGVIKKIGEWVNDGTTEILAEIRHNGDYTNVTWVGVVPDDDEDLDDDEDDEDEDDEDDDEDDL